MALVTTTLGFTGDWQKFRIPNNVSNIALSGTGGGASGHFGGGLVGELRVKDTDVLWIQIGRKGFSHSGKNGAAQCYPNGSAGGDGGSPARNGGDGGGGATIVRLNGPDGRVVMVVGGAGGDCGDGSLGGAGGGIKGQNGSRADASANFAIGGGQVHGGNGGRIPGSPNFNGVDATDVVVDRGGSGGFAANDKANGGGGGGGGYHGGGGGQAGKAGVWWGGGGGGGSNFADELHNVTYNAQAFTVDHGALQIWWFEGGDLPPNTPSDTIINGVGETSEMLLREQSATISAKPTDSTTDQGVRIRVLLSPQPISGDIPAGASVTGQPIIEQFGTWDPTGQRDFTQFSGLRADTLYYGRIYSQDKRGQQSAGFVTLKFWTDRAPNAPVNTSPDADTEFEPADLVVFEWTNSDPDQDTGFPETPNGWAFRWRHVITASSIPGSTLEPSSDPTVGEWVYAWHLDGGAVTTMATAGQFGVGRIQWSVASRVRELWSPWSTPSEFGVIAAALPPIPHTPINGIAQFANEPTLFTWQFRTEVAGERQTTADIRYRPYGTEDWITLDGDGVVPGSGPRWTLDEETFAENTAFEWQVRTHTTSETTSDWSASVYFWSVRKPGQFLTDPVPVDWTRVKETLGEGVNRVYLYRRGGKIPLGELTPLTDVQWNRKRDDIGKITIHINQWSDDSIGLLRQIRSWATELVVFRTVGTQTERVAEGPVVRISDTVNGLEVEAQDVMVVVKRRLLRQGYNDSYQCQAKDAFGNCLDQLGLHTVVYRAERIITNALAYDDPDVLPYLTALHNSGDAVQSRIVKAYSKGAWEEVDDMAANAGLDYVTVGRRIILNDTHRPIGRLPEMSNADFSENPVITEYGMSYATDWAVTNNNGLYGLAVRGRAAPLGTVPLPDITLEGDAAETGYVEQIASQYGESDESGIGADDLTAAEIAAIRATLAAQADRNIASRYPLPRVVRVPDNANILPSCPVGINHLVPGVWIPLRAKGLILEASQWQKLDSMSVRQDAAGEKVSVVMSPAPNGGTDPDAELPVEEA